MDFTNDKPHSKSHEELSVLLAFKVCQKGIKKTYATIVWAVLFIILTGCAGIRNAPQSNAHIQPYSKNPAYWQYQGEPVLLLGATNDDNLFQIENLEDHLEQLSVAGGNYIRNTMSYRDSGNVNPYLEVENGQYDLDRWSPVFWEKFSNLLKWSNERDIIVQIEVWDRFDFSREPWQTNPWHPKNNVNNLPDGIFNGDYPAHPSADQQPFFHTIPGMPLYHPGLDRIRRYQEKYIDKLLSFTLEYGNVLYCMNNETSTPVDWGNYWINYIRSRANAKGKLVYLTDMYDHFFQVNSCARCLDLIADPEFYTFLDISQINSRNFGQDHWDTLQQIMDLRDQYPLRPVNHTKVYGGGNSSWGSGTNEDGVERFCRNIIGGSAAVRHHRPPSGNGLNDKAIGSIQATREVEKWVKFWDVSVHLQLLKDREENECYITSRPGESYVLYFPKSGHVTLDLTEWDIIFEMKKISVRSGCLTEKATIQGGSKISISTDDDTGWYVVLIRKE